MGNLKAKEDGIRILLDGNVVKNETDVFFFFKEKSIIVNTIEIGKQPLFPNGIEKRDYNVSIENYNGDKIELGVYSVNEIDSNYSDNITTYSIKLKFKE